MTLHHIICDRHAAVAPQRVALRAFASDGRESAHTFGMLRRDSLRFANVLRAHGLSKGDRVALMLGQSAEFVIALLACSRLGLIFVPIASAVSGPGLLHRLSHSRSSAVVLNAAGLEKLRPLQSQLDARMRVWLTEGAAPEAHDFWADISRSSEGLDDAGPVAVDAAYIIYTSGTTGLAKAVLHRQEGLSGQLPALRQIHGGLGLAGDLAWTPADWSWMAGFAGILLAFLAVGSPVIAWQPPPRFDPAGTLDFLRRHRVRNTMLVPTMLRRMKASGVNGELFLRSLFCTGESLPMDLYEYCRSSLGLTPGEGYGQTELAPATVMHEQFMALRPGSLGRPAPGLKVAILSSEGEPLPAGERGEIAFGRGHQAMYSNYWGDELATQQKFIGDWMRTGDEGVVDDEGYFWFLGRVDDVIKSAGYRIGPAEIEERMALHPAVQGCAVVGLPDPDRGEVVTAAIVLKKGQVASDALAVELIHWAKAGLEGYQAPRVIRFISELPLTVTGKVMRKSVREGLIDAPRQGALI